MKKRSTTWNALFNGGSKNDQILEILEYINLSSSQSYTTPDLMYGKMGVSIFHLYYFLFKSDNRNLDKATELVEQSINLITELPNPDTGLGKGISGVLWGFNHFIA